jgi:uncharacterized protein YqcC (DUF446 family)
VTAARERALIAVVDGLEAELRRMRLWEPVPPSQELLASPQPFCVDTLALSQWLQWMLIPRMRKIFSDGGELPSASAIHPYAEDCFEHLDDSSKLLLLIERFDGLIRGEAVLVTH